MGPVSVAIGAGAGARAPLGAAATRPRPHPSIRPQGLGIVIAAVYQRSLRLTYVDGLLSVLTAAFAANAAGAPLTPGSYPSFDATFKKALAAAEAKAGTGGAPAVAADAARAAAAPPPQQQAEPSSSSSDDDDRDPSSAPASSTGGSAVDLARLRAKGAAAAASKKGARGKPGGANPPKPKVTGDPPKKEARVWAGQAPKGAAAAALDCSDAAGPASIATVDLTVKSRVDGDESESESDDDEAALAGAGAAVPAKAGALASFVRTLGVSLVGSSSLTAEDVAPALDALKKRLVERNVAEPVAAKVVDSVAASLVGASLPSLTRVATAVRAAVEAALVRVLTPRRSVDVLREARAAAAAGRPYVIVFVGVNGVGKSTSLSKVGEGKRSGCGVCARGDPSTTPLPPPPSALPGRLLAPAE